MIVGLGDDQLAGFFDSGDPYDRYVWTPWGIEAFVRQTDTEFRSVAKDFSRAADAFAITSDTLADFNLFYNEWAGYFDGITSWTSSIPGWGAFWWSDTVKTVKAYRERLLAWSKKLTAQGIETTTPLPGAEGPRGDQNSVKNLLSTVTGLVIAGGVVYVGYRVINETGLLAKIKTKLR